jgi:hypothetical protein
MVSPADALRYQQAGSEPKTIRWYEAGHGLEMAAYRDQAEWLRELIGIAGYRTAFPPSVRGILIAWFLLTVMSLAFLVVDLWHTQLAPRGAGLLWLLTTAFLGPLGLVAYWISGRGPGRAGESAKLPPATPLSPVCLALGSAAWAAAGNSAGVILVLGLALYLPQMFTSPVLLIATMILAPFCAGWSIFAASRWISRSDGRFMICYRRPFLAEMVSTCLVLAGAYPTLIALIMRFFGRWTAPFGFDLTYAPLWGGLGLACLAGTLVTYPFHLWMIRRGVIRCGEAAMSGKVFVSKLAWYQQAALVLPACAVVLSAIFLSLRIV